MEKLELKNLAPYLPYGLMVQYEGAKKYEVILLESKTLQIRVSRFPYRLRFSFSEIKPILRPLSDLTKEIEVNGEKFVPYDYFYDDPENDWFDGNVWLNYMFEGNIDKTDLNFIPYYIVQKLLEWHFNIFDLPENLYVNYNNI